MSLQDGCFTSAILASLADAGSDRDHDGWRSIDELRASVSTRVASDTDDLQHPTIDRDNSFQRFALPLLSPH